MKILRVVGRMDRGGIETSIMHVLRRLDRERFSTDFLYVDPDGRSVYDDEIRRLGHAIHHCPKQDLLAFARRFRRINRAHGPYDVVHASLHRFNGYVARVAATAGIPSVIVHSHNDTSMVDGQSGLMRRSYFAAQRWLIRRYATAGLAVSRKAAASLYGSDWERDPRWRICYQGRDLEPFAVAPDRAAVLSELGLPQNAYVMGLVGRLDAQKNHAFLLHVLQAALHHEPRARLLLIGDGPLRDEIRRQVEDRKLTGHVVMTGDRQDIVRLLGAMDVFVMPSLYEGLPMALVEAQAAGVPCVLSDSITDEASVVPEILQRLSLSEAADTWARAALTPRRVSRSHALAVVDASPFSLTRCIERFAEIYSGPGRSRP